LIFSTNRFKGDYDGHINKLNIEDGTSSPLIVSVSEMLANILKSIT
jgi:hypothetical protein